MTDSKKPPLPDFRKPFKVKYLGHTIESRDGPSPTPSGIGMTTTIEVVVTSKAFPSKEAGAPVITVARHHWKDAFDAILSICEPIAP